ncbi:MAG TPA: heme-binding protein [Thermodesulfobacteriota bacterium]|nr:heme-binding protein [Thermodesulfobacteriota bacterium]
MIQVKGFIVTAFILVMAATSQAQVMEKKSLSLDGARKVIAAAEAEAKRLNAPGGVIAVVDDGGNLMALERLDGTFAAGANISIGKARTAAIFKRTTSVFEEIIKNGRTSMVALVDFTPLQGGVPIIFDGEVIGAVGVSGAASAKQDEELAIAGANAIMSTSASTKNGSQSITYFDKNKVSTAFAKGMPLTEISNYKVHASRRTEPGMAEVHVKDTDIIYVLEGSATLVTGGTVVDGKATAQDEIRGKEISGGQAQKITKGDVIIVPAGTPHWFKNVQGPVLYYVVKVG